LATSSSSSAGGADSLAVVAQAGAAASSGRAPPVVVTPPSAAGVAAAAPTLQPLEPGKKKEETAERKNVADTSVNLAALRASSSNMLHMAMTIVSNEPLHSTWLLVCHCTNPVKRENGISLRQFTTVAGCEEWCSYMAQPKSKCYIQEMWKPFEDFDLLRELGLFQHGSTSSSWSLPDNTADVVNLQANHFHIYFLNHITHIFGRPLQDKHPKLIDF
jgi:hypothetical protein